jgi:TRAP-type mannitol/chloroaromatic compound transport system permease small subunit
MNTPVRKSSSVEAIGFVHPLQPLFNILAAIGTIWIFLLMLLVVADVLGRNFFNMPITGVAEFSGRSVAAIVFLQLAAAIGSGKMTRSDFLQRTLLRFFPKAVQSIEVIFQLLAAFVFSALAYISWPSFIQSYESLEFFGVQGIYTIPTWPFKGLLVVGSVMASLAYLLNIPGILRDSIFSTGVHQ